MPDKQADNRGINKSSEPLKNNGITAGKTKEAFPEKQGENRELTKLQNRLGIG